MSWRATLNRIAYPVLKLGVLILRPYLRGVRVVIRNGDDVLLVRHTYGKTTAWGLPGGLLAKNEDPLEGGIRETREETGLALTDAVLVPGNPFPAIISRGELWIAQATAASRELTIQPVEIAEARWFPRDRIPFELLKDTEVALKKAGIL